MGFIIASAVIRSEANLTFRRNFPSSLFIYSSRESEIDKQFGYFARTTQAKVVQFNRAALISV